MNIVEISLSCYNLVLANRQTTYNSHVDNSISTLELFILSGMDET